MQSAGREAQPADRQMRGLAGEARPQQRREASEQAVGEAEAHAERGLHAEDRGEGKAAGEEVARPQRPADQDGEAGDMRDRLRDEGAGGGARQAERPRGALQRQVVLQDEGGEARDRGRKGGQDGATRHRRQRLAKVVERKLLPDPIEAPRRQRAQPNRRARRNDAPRNLDHAGGNEQGHAPPFSGSGRRAARAGRSGRRTASPPLPIWGRAGRGKRAMIVSRWGAASPSLTLPRCGGGDWSLNAAGVFPAPKLHEGAAKSLSPSPSASRRSR